MTTRVVGVDGARGGWMVASTNGSGRLGLDFIDSLASVVDDLRSGRCAVAAIDMPIGLSADGQRLADTEARKRLGARRSTFFPTPVRAVLDADDFDDANERSRRASGKGLSIQAWNLVAKIRELDNAWSPDLADRLCEAHPELSFAAMNGGIALTAPKATPEGQQQRRALLDAHLSGDCSSAIDALARSLQVDAIDALGLAWTARRIAAGTAEHVGGQLDTLDRPMSLRI